MYFYNENKIIKMIDNIGFYEFLRRYVFEENFDLSNRKIKKIYKELKKHRESSIALNDLLFHVNYE